MRATRPLPLVLALLLSQLPLPSESLSINENECFSKGGLGIIRPEVYVVTRSVSNEILLSHGQRWVGEMGSRRQVLFVFGDKVVEHPTQAVAFDLSKAIVISFQEERIYFYDFAAGKGGYYRRLSP